MEVTVLPSPEAVGVVAVTRISFPFAGNAGSERRSSRSLAPYLPIGSKYFSGKFKLRAMVSIGSNDGVIVREGETDECKPWRAAAQI